MVEHLWYDRFEGQLSKQRQLTQLFVKAHLLQQIHQKLQRDKAKQLGKEPPQTVLSPADDSKLTNIIMATVANVKEAQKGVGSNLE